MSVEEAASDPPADDPPAAAVGRQVDRRRMPRTAVEIHCNVHTGAHVHSASIRDISAEGAMLRGVPGLLPGDVLQLRLSRLPGRAIVALVRGVSLLGIHIEIAGPAERAAWQEAVRDILP